MGKLKALEVERRDLKFGKERVGAPPRELGCNAAGSRMQAGRRRLLFSERKGVLTTSRYIVLVVPKGMYDTSNLHCNAVVCIRSTGPRKARSQ